MRLDDQCRLSRDLQIGKRQHVRRRQARREMVHKRPHAFVVHRAVVYRDQLVASHQAEAPPGGSVVCRVQGYALPVTEARRIRHGAERSQAIGPRGEHPREIALLLRVARGHVEAAVAAAVAAWFTAAARVYAHAPMLLSARFRAQRAVR